MKFLWREKKSKFNVATYVCFVYFLLKAPNIKINTTVVHWGSCIWILKYNPNPIESLHQFSDLQLFPNTELWY